MAPSTQRRTRRRWGAGAHHGAPTPCALCRDEVTWVDYKNLPLLRRYMSDRGKIHARRMTGNCARHQNEVAMAIKTARELVLLPRPVPTETAGSSGGGR